jgi:hypothetical protein
MLVQLTMLGNRKFLHLDGRIAIPIDRIKRFDFNVANGGASGHSVKIVTDDPDEEFIYAFENCDAIKAFLEENVIE